MVAVLITLEINFAALQSRQHCLLQHHEKSVLRTNFCLDAYNTRMAVTYDA
jgi:hypothetical protein